MLEAHPHLADVLNGGKEPLKRQHVGDVALQQSSQHRSDQIHYSMYGTKNHVNHYGMHVQCMPRHIENPPFRRLGRLASLTNNIIFTGSYTPCISDG